MRLDLRNLTLPALLALVACGEGTLTPGSAPVSLYLTDAAGDVEAVWVEILHVYMEGDNTEGDPEPMDLLEASTELVKLTDLTESDVSIAQSVELPAGTYRELRFVFGGAVLETTDGEVYVKDGAVHPDGLEPTGVLVCPSCSQSGLKVKFSEPLELEQDGVAILADFDVSQSFGKDRGASGQWVMHPVIHAGAMDASGEITGTVALAEGLSLPACPDGTDHGLDVFVPMAEAQTLVDDSAQPIMRSGHTNPDGTFAIGNLAEDTYTLGYDSEIAIGDYTLSIVAEVTPADATVVAGTTQDGVAYTITEASCVPPA